MTAPDRWARMAANPELDPAQAIELPETGWGSLVAWIAGPRWVHPDPSRAIPPIRQTVLSGTATVVTTADRTAEEQREIDDDITEYLRDAEVPAPPRTVRWSLRRPGDMSDQAFWAHLNSSMDQRCRSARHPAEVHECLASVLTELLSSGRGADESGA